MMKKALIRITALLAALILLSGLTACGRKPETGDKLKSNVARAYSRGDRCSRFFRDAAPIAGEVSGKAYLDAAANGSAALAWVDSLVYFVSEKGVEPLGSGISAAEISFDGNTAYYLLDGVFMRYSADTGEKTGLVTGVDSVVQIAISPGAECAVLTAEFTEGGQRSVLIKGGEVSPVLTDGRDTVLAVSDGADIVYYFDASSREFRVEKDGESILISRECGAASSFNFTNDLSEVSFLTDSRKTEIYRLSDGLSVSLGTGFGYTLKTDVYSMNTVTWPVYINGVGSFLNGLWARRDRTEAGEYLFSIAYVDKNGADWIVLGAADGFKVSDDAKRIIWMEYDQLKLTEVSGKTTLLARDVSAFTCGGDCGKAYYISNAGSLFEVGKGGKPKKLDSAVSFAEAVGGGCAYIKNMTAGDDGSGTLVFFKDGKAREIMAGASYFETRSGQLMLFASPEKTEYGVLYTLYLTADGVNWTEAARSVDP